MGVPAVEKSPGGLKSPWLDIWRGALREMKKHGTWSPAMRPLLDDYVNALRTAEEHRTVAEARPFAHSHATDRDFMHPGFTSADREMKRAHALADALGLTPRGRKALNLTTGESDGGSDDPFAGLDEVAQRRARRGSG